jgi:Xaa-Pro aminopeptidase
MNESDTKVDRVARIAREAAAGGVLLTLQRNFAWLTGGASNRVDGSREPGAGALFVRADGRRFVVANAIEMPRLRSEALAGLGFEPVEYPWTDDQANPASALQYARAVTSGTAPIAADAPITRDTLGVETALMRARVHLVEEETARYRTLGRDIGLAVGEACRSLRPGSTEREIANVVAAAVYRADARPVVLLVGADERIARFRHPVATDHVWRKTVMVAVCAERHGLIASLSRLLNVGALDSTLRERTAATAQVFAKLLEASRSGNSGAQLFDVASRAYAEAGYPHEEEKHHQGGAIGYRTREWVAHPRSEEVVVPTQAFAWNPTITGTKVEDTALLVNGELDLITASPGWPTIELRDGRLAAADVLAI